MPSVADVYLTVHVSEREVKKEIERGAREGAAKADTGRAGEAAGRRFGQGFDKGSKKDLAKVGGSVGRLAGEVTGLGGAFTVGSRKANIFSRVLAGVGLATGLLESPTSALVGTTGALAGAFTAAGAGLGAYGLALLPFIQKQKQATQLQARAMQGSKAAQKQLADLMKTMPPAFKEFNKQVGNATAAYKGWSDSLAVPVLSPITPLLKGVKGMLTDIRPLVFAASGALKQLVGELMAKVDGGGLARFVDAILPHVRPAIVDFGHVVANIVGGLWGIIKAFLPFSDSVTGALVNLTKRFRDWATTLDTHSGFRALVKQWQENWPLMRQGLGDLVGILKNIVGDMAAMTTGGNSRALWLALNPLLRVTLALSSHPLLVQALVYLLAIGKTGSRIAGVFNAIKSGWGGITKFIALVTGGKVQLGMQTAGDTMMLAAKQMQAAADTMVGAGGVGGPGGGLSKAERAAEKGGKPFASLPERAIMGAPAAGFWGVAIGTAALSLIAAASPGGVHGPQQRGPHGETPPTGRAAALGLPTIPQQEKMRGAYEHAGVIAGQAFSKGLAQPLNDLTSKQGALGRSSNVVSAQFDKQAKATGAAGTALNQYTSEIHTNGLRSAETRAARTALVNDMVAAGVNGKTARTDVAAYTEAIRKNGYGTAQAKAARQQLIDDIKHAFLNSQQGKRDMTRYTDAVRINGTKSDVTHGARKQLITDLENSGLTAKEARDLVKQLTDRITGIPKHSFWSMLMHGTGRWTVAQAKKFAAGHGVTTGGVQTGLAGGGQIRGPGGPTADRAGLFALSDREWVIRAASARKYGERAMSAVNEGTARIAAPGLAQGGRAGSRLRLAGDRDVLTGQAVTDEYRRDFRNIRDEMVRQMWAAMKRQMRAAMGGIWPFPGGRDLSQLRRVDEGQDMQYPGTSPVNVFAIMPGTRTTLGPDPGGFGNAYPGLRLDAPYQGFRAIYYGHIHPAGRGGHLNAGDVIGRTFGPTSGGDAAGLPNWLEIGFMPISWANGPAMHRLLTRGGAGGPGSLRGGSWTLGGLERLWDQAGGPPSVAHVAAAIALAESGGRAWARNPSGATGLWQILGNPFPGDATNPYTNARMAVAKYHGARDTFRPWVTYTDGAYRQFMGGGGVIDEPVFGLGASGRQYVIGESGPETVIPGRHPMRGTEARLEALADVVAALPDMIGSAVADALDGVSRRGAYRSAYSAR